MSPAGKYPRERSYEQQLQVFTKHVRGAVQCIHSCTTLTEGQMAKLVVPLQRAIHRATKYLTVDKER